MNLCFLVSGGGGTLRAVYHAFELLGRSVSGFSVVADRDCGALQFARSRRMDSALLEYRRGNAKGLQQHLQAVQPQVVVTNIHKIIDPDTLAHVSGRFVNLHYSLLPSFAGLIGMRTLHDARERNSRIIGATCHEVVAEVDSGPILSQAAIACDWKVDDQRILEDCVFRAGSMCLLDVVLEAEGGGAGREGNSSIVRLRENRLALFSPSPGFDVTILDEAYWGKVSLG